MATWSRAVPGADDAGFPQGPAACQEPCPAADGRALSQPLGICSGASPRGPPQAGSLPPAGHRAWRVICPRQGCPRPRSCKPTAAFRVMRQMGQGAGCGAPQTHSGRASLPMVEGARYHEPPVRWRRWPHTPRPLGLLKLPQGGRPQSFGFSPSSLEGTHIPPRLLTHPPLLPQQV